MYSTTHLEVDISPSKFFFVNEPQTVRWVWKEERRTGSRKSGVVTEELDKECWKSLAIAPLFITSYEGQVSSRIRYGEKCSTLEAPMLPALCVSMNGGNWIHAGRSSHLEPFAVKAHRPITSWVKLTTMLDDLMPEGKLRQCLAFFKVTRRSEIINNTDDIGGRWGSKRNS